MSYEDRLELPAGGSMVVRVVVVKPDNSPLDLAGGSGWWYLARHSRAAGQDVLIEKPCLLEQVSINGQDYWRLSFEIESNDTLNLPPRTYHHECWVQTATPQLRPYRVLVGPFELGPSVWGA